MLRQTLPRRNPPRSCLQSRNRPTHTSQTPSQRPQSPTPRLRNRRHPPQRTRPRVNAHCTALGRTNVILISIHVNAAGDGSQWMNATGWSCYICKGQTESDLLADCLYTVADCAAVLTENYFMDYHSDLEYLQSRAGKQAVVDIHVEGIVEYLED